MKCATRTRVHTREMICGLVMGFGRGGHGAAPACGLHARWAELPKMLGSVQISAQVFEPYLAVANKLAVLHWLFNPSSGPLEFLKLGYKS